MPTYEFEIGDAQGDGRLQRITGPDFGACLDSLRVLYPEGLWYITDCEKIDLNDEQPL